VHPPLGLEAFLDGTDAVSVKQAKEFTEILVGYDVANRYQVSNARGHAMGEVLEESSGFVAAMSRNMLGVWRSMTLHVRDNGGFEVANLEKGFSLFFHRIDVYQGEEHLGSIQRRFSLLGRKYQVCGPDERPVANLKRPFFRLWTYPAYDLNGKEIGRIAKKWGGVLTEVFTDADTYGVQFTDGCDPRLRSLLFCALFLVDITNTEDNAGSKGLLSFRD
jgi:hypothetical protein